ncbi:hypothetical protein HDU86_004689 [Geranomyces michiganensis]|nr:hypothetical protein HDU86_004689 [Geranomyces michiganensis]
MQAIQDRDVQSDNKLCRLALNAMSALIKRASNAQQEVLVDSADALTACFATGIPNAQNTRTTLDLLATLICGAGKDANPGVHIIAVGPPAGFATALRTLLTDSRWDVRDSTISLLTRFLRQPAHTPPVSFLLLPPNQDLLQMIIARATTTTDENQPYVRATAISCLRAAVLNPRVRLAGAGGAELVAQCVERMVNAARSDTESFVRRAGVEALVAVVAVDAGRNAAAWSINREMLEKVLGDEDVEVRVTGIRLLAALFATEDEVDAAAADDGCESRPWVFAAVGGTELIVAACEDYSRLVRQETYTTLREVMFPRLARSGGCGLTASSKRDRIAGSELETVAERLLRIDMDRLQASAAPEHVYQEVLDVDESILREDRAVGAGNNRLACYDC